MKLNLTKGEVMNVDQNDELNVDDLIRQTNELIEQADVLTGAGGSKGNRKQRRAMLNRHHRGVGFTRQYSSARARRKYGRLQKEKNLSLAQWQKMRSALNAAKANIAARANQEPISESFYDEYPPVDCDALVLLNENTPTTEEYADLTGDLEGAFDLLGDEASESEWIQSMIAKEEEIGELFPQGFGGGAGRSIRKEEEEVIEAEDEVSGSFMVAADTHEGVWSSQNEAEIQNVIQRISTSNVKEAIGLVDAGSCDRCLAQVEAAEIAGRNRVTVLRALQARR